MILELPELQTSSLDPESIYVSGDSFSHSSWAESHVFKIIPTKFNICIQCKSSHAKTEKNVGPIKKFNYIDRDSEVHRQQWVRKMQKIPKCDIYKSINGTMNKTGQAAETNIGLSQSLSYQKVNNVKYYHLTRNQHKLWPKGTRQISTMKMYCSFKCKSIDKKISKQSTTGQIKRENQSTTTLIDIKMLVQSRSQAMQHFAYIARRP